jgi:arsenite-transporting ATPase
LLPDAVVKGIEEQLSGACTTEIAAFDEFTALLTDAELLARHDTIVFDTAPTGHTIRLLQLPGAWTGFLEEGKGDASCLGPLAGLEKHRAQYKAAVDALANAERTRLILVARAQKSTLQEAARTHEELAALGLTQQYLVINGILPEAETAGDPLAAAIWKREQEALAALPGALAVLPTDRLPLTPFNLVGLPALRGLLDDAAAPPAPTDFVAPPDLQAPDLASLIDSLEEGGHGLIMLMGKGGVGKTTLAAAIALELARRGYPVHLTTSDPAAHLSATLDDDFAQLNVSRIDPQIETARYRRHVIETRGKDLDAHGRALLEEDLRSPCTEEIAVFQAFSRVIDEADRKFVVMDTAPTGHTLLLLDATGAYHRESARQMQATENTPFATPMMRLQDGKRTKVLIVTLAETTPVLEAAGLQADLRRAGIEPFAWIVNHCLAGSAPASPLLRQRAANELVQIDAVAKHHTQHWAVVPLQAEEPVGAVRLRHLAHRANPLEKST